MEALNKSLANELTRMAEADQSMRIDASSEDALWDCSVDEANQASLQEILDTEGWPTIAKVGTEASRAAWLIAQHAPSLEFMERCLGLMESLPNGEINPANIAYLKDRVLMMNNQPQIYGTQFHAVGNDIQAWPIEDVENIDELRASIGLGPLSQYESKLRARFGPQSKKSVFR